MGPHMALHLVFFLASLIVVLCMPVKCTSLSRTVGGDVLVSHRRQEHTGHSLNAQTVDISSFRYCVKHRAMYEHTCISVGPAVFILGCCNSYWIAAEGTCQQGVFI